MKFTGINNGIVGGILKFVLVLILGIVIAIGGEALAVYMLLTKEGSVGKLEDAANSGGVKVEFDDEIRNKSLLAWGKELFATLSNMSNAKIGDIEKQIGVTIISDTIFDMIGVDKTTVQNSNLGDIGKTITANLTVSVASEKLGITFPDMPLFKDASFLSLPLADALSKIDTYPIEKLISIDENSNSVLQQIKSIAVKDLGSQSTNDVIMGTFIGELMTIDDKSTDILKSIRYASIESIYEKDEDGNIKVDESGNKIFKTKSVVVGVTPDGSPITELKPLKGINEFVKNDLTVNQVMPINEASNVFLRKMRKPTEEEVLAGKGYLFGTEDIKIEEMSVKVTGIMNQVLMCEMMTIDSTSALTLQALKYACIESQYEKNEDGSIKVDADGNKIYKTTQIVENGVLKTVPLVGFNDKIKDLKLSDVMVIGDDAHPVLKKLRDKSVKIENIGTEMTNIVNDTTIGELMNKDTFESPLLNKLKDSKISTLDADLQNLQIKDLFTDTSTGLLSLLPDTTKLNEMPSAVQATLTTTNVAVMEGIGIITIDTTSMNSLKKGQRSFVYNSTLSGMLNGMLGFIGDPITVDISNPMLPPSVNYNYITPKTTELNTDYASFTDFIAAYKQFDTIKLTGNVTVTLQDTELTKFSVGGDYVLPLFSLDKNGFELTFKNSASDVITPKLGIVMTLGDNYIFTNSVITLAKNQYAYTYCINGNETSVPAPFGVVADTIKMG